MREKMEPMDNPNGERVSIVTDIREEPSQIAALLERMNVNVTRRRLDVADYVCSERVAVERKTVGDFLASITDQRIFRQMHDISEAYQCPVLLLEGDPMSLFSKRDISANAIRGALASIALDYRVPVLWSSTPKESAAMLHRFAWREQIKEKRELQIRPSKKTETMAQKQEYLIAGLPHVSNMLSRRLLKHFGGPKEIFNASMKEFQAVDGIGKKKAQLLWEIMNGKYGA